MQNIGASDTECQQKLWASVTKSNAKDSETASVLCFDF